jgi:hypothetical protein
MRRTTLALAVLLGYSMASTAPYTIKVTAKPIGRFTVQVNVTSNLPDTAVLAAELGLTNQKPDDVFIGTNYQEIRLKKGKASFIIDGNKRVMPVGSTLPSGQYDVGVSFYPLWEQNRDTAARLKVSSSIEGSTRITLGGSGASASSAQKKQADQKWVMLNVNSGDEWRSGYYTQRFGNYTELPLDNGNPRILKMYYFPSIDMTFMVNVYKGEIELWRRGKANR